MLCFFLVSGVFFATPQRAEAGGGWAVFFKEISDVAGWFFGDRILRNISNEALDWAKTGFGNLTENVNEDRLDIGTEFALGDEAFLVNPTAFFSDVQSDVSRYFLTELSNEIGGALPESFGDRIVEELAKQQQHDLSPRDQFTELESTIPNDELEAFMDDFSEGGWGTFLELTGNPNNYFDGALLAAQSELNDWQTEMEQQYREELQQGEGFLTLRECDDFEGSQPDAIGCSAYKKVTPGSIVGDRTGRSTSTDIERVKAADEITELIAVMVSMIFNELLDKGLSGFTEQSGGEGAQGAFEDSLNDIADNVRDQDDTEEGAYDTAECAFKADDDEDDIEECFENRGGDDDFESEFLDCVTEADGDEEAIEQCAAEQEEREREAACQTWESIFPTPCPSPEDATTEEIEKIIEEHQDEQEAYWRDIKEACDAIRDMGGVPTDPRCQIADEMV